MKKLVGVFVSMTMLGSGAALAQGDSASQDARQQTSGAAQGGSGAAGSDSMQGASGTSSSSGSMDQGGSGSAGSASSMTRDSMGQQELTGKVVKANSKMVWVDHMGAVVPLEVDSKTQFTDPSLKAAKNLKEGQEIRASFEVKDTKNVAKSIAPSSAPSTGTGGSSTPEGTSPDSSVHPGTGGSGMGTSPEDQGTGGSTKDKGMNPDTKSGSSASPDTY
ncbi:RNA-binding protein [Myxococcaceae bacterium JPH2]|nr:RNA-binding protein [Myxococcaceae bacterium JPH2]